ncbi:MAG: GNAT family N-acetyltransferase, partial [Chloroflexi bacterium]|nr:GNAT family N-acetyltransferase [Chloroflexota bacterium]
MEPEVTPKNPTGRRARIGQPIAFLVPGHERNQRIEGIDHRIEFRVRAQRYGFGRWAGIEKTKGAFIGAFSLRPPDEGRLDELELGYRLRRAAWGQGYATEGARALVARGFAEPSVQHIIAHTMTVN